MIFAPLDSSPPAASKYGWIKPRGLHPLPPGGGPVRECPVQEIPEGARTPEMADIAPLGNLGGVHPPLIAVHFSPPSPSPSPHMGSTPPSIASRHLTSTGNPPDPRPHALQYQPPLVILIPHQTLFHPPNTPASRSFITPVHESPSCISRQTISGGNTFEYKHVQDCIDKHCYQLILGPSSTPPDTIPIGFVAEGEGP